LPLGGPYGKRSTKTKMHSLIALFRVHPSRSQHPPRRVLTLKRAVEGLQSTASLPMLDCLKCRFEFSETALRRPVVLGREMAITKEKKQEIIGTFGRADIDTGSPEVQVALLTARINDLTGHFKTHAKDHASRRGLLMMVSKRSSLLKYLRLHDRKKYLDVIGRLGIRK
jgi:small subunit ribosomal protein S15